MAGAGAFLPGCADVYVNNTCVLANAGDQVVDLGVGDRVLPAPADFAQRLTLAGNTIFAPGGAPAYGGPPAASGPLSTYADFQAAGYDTSVVRADVPDAATMIAWARAMPLPPAPGAPSAAA